MTDLFKIKLCEDSHFSIVPAHVKYDQIVIDTSSNTVSFSYQGKKVAEMTFSRLNPGDTMTITNLKGEVGLMLA